MLKLGMGNCTTTSRVYRELVLIAFYGVTSGISREPQRGVDRVPRNGSLPTQRGLPRYRDPRVE